MSEHPHRSDVRCTPSVRPAHRTRRPRGRELGPSRVLTSAERRVAELICEGHSRTSVARTLFVSVNTVGTHLRSVYAKLQVNSRMQLLLVLGEHDAAESRPPA